MFLFGHLFFFEQHLVRHSLMTATHSLETKPVPVMLKPGGCQRTVAGGDEEDDAVRTCA